MRDKHTIAGSVLLSSNKSLGVEETPVRAVPDLINNIGLEVDVQRTGHVFARGSFGEERAEATIVGRRRPFQETTVGLATYQLVR